MTKEEFDVFFESYAKNVDEANTQNFWKLSDALILEIIKRHVPDPGQKGVILDAGGGTARWAILLSKIYASKFTVFDLSIDMLKKAQKNIEKERLGERISLLKGDLADMSNVLTESVDHVISIYSPLSFIEDRDKALSELHRILRRGGKVLVMGHGYYNAIASKINNYRAAATELHGLDRESLVKWAPSVPVLNVFSKEGLEKMLSDAGFITKQTFGVPVFVQPGLEDFDSENKLRSEISKALEDGAFFNAVFDLEMKHNGEAYVANRGMNIFALAEKK